MLEIWVAINNRSPETIRGKNPPYLPVGFTFQKVVQRILTLLVVFLAIMAVQCNFLHCYTYKPCIANPMFPFSSALFISTRKTPLYVDANTLKLPTNRLGRVISAVVSEEKAVGSSSSGSDMFKLTYLEGNSWLWEVGGLRILVDPILVGNLDFGIPWLYDAAKKFLKTFQLSDLPEIDYLLITQSLDDHCHLKTLKPLAQKLPNLRVIATPNAKALLDPLFKNVKYLEPGQSFELEASNGSQVKVQATSGPVLGPPWQRPENGYLVTSPQGQLTLYYEPHCVYNRTFLEKERADIVITPVIKQLLPKFTLVSGQEDAVQLAKLLRAKFIVPMQNGELDSKGLLATLVQSDGTVESFKEHTSVLRTFSNMVKHKHINQEANRTEIFNKDVVYVTFYNFHNFWSGHFQM